VQKGGYVLSPEVGELQLILLASGSEVQHAIAAQKTLQADGVATRVVSMPCWELFEIQDAAYREEVLPAACTKRVSMEAGSRFGWERYVGLDGKAIGMNEFGASAPAGELMQHFGFTAENMVAVAKQLLS
jgi:transketolase